MKKQGKSINFQEFKSIAFNSFNEKGKCETNQKREYNNDIGEFDYKPKVTSNNEDYDEESNYE